MTKETPLTSVSVQEALEAILANFSPLEPASVALEHAVGFVLAEDVHGDMDLPPFDNSAMDGYAVQAADTAGTTPGSPAHLKVTGYIPAGAAPGPNDVVTPGTAMRIMTGAPVPPGADAVVRFEDTDEGRVLDDPHRQPASKAAPMNVGAEVQIFHGVKSGDSVRPSGEDTRAGELVLSAGTAIRAAEISVLAAVGKARVLVHRRPRVAILATGDELVDVSERPGPGQIRNTNNYAVAAQVSSW